MKMSPSDVPSSLVESGPGAPPYRAQRNVIWAFRKFIQNPSNRNSFDGGEWTPMPILRKLWELWHERPAEPGIEYQFCALYYKTIERLRGKGKKAGVDDRLLYILVRRFLEANSISVIERLKLRHVRDVISSMAALVPEGNMSPVRDCLWSSGVKVYRIAIDGHGHECRFFALDVKISETNTAGVACPAIFFCPNTLILERGVYFFAYGQAWLRTDTGDKTRFYVIHFRKSGYGKELILSVDFHAYGSWPYGGPEPWGGSKVPAQFQCMPCNDDPIKAIAKRIFEKFDVEGSKAL